MSESVAKKTKIYKLATELNLSSETIIEFLHKKGFEVKNHMSTVTDDMMSAILGHFKKEKDVAERHHRKLQEFRTSRKKEPVEKVEKKAVVVEEVLHVPTVVEEPVVEQAAQAPVEAGIPSPPPVERPLPEPAPKEVPIVVAPPVSQEEVVAKRKVGPSERKVKPLSPLEQALARPRKGLTIKGRIEIAAGAPGAGVAGEESEEEKKKKKKKKKKVPEGKKPGIRAP